MWSLKTQSWATKCSSPSVCTPELLLNYLTQGWVGSTAVLAWCPACVTCPKSNYHMQLQSRQLHCFWDQASSKTTLCHVDIHRAVAEVQFEWMNCAIFQLSDLMDAALQNLFPWQCRDSNGNTGSFLLYSQYKEQNKNLFSIWMNKSRSIFQCKHVKPKSFPCPDHSKIHE